MSSMPPDEERLAFTRQRVAQLAGVELATLDRWDRTHLAGAGQRGHVTQGREVRLYRYQDLLDVLIIAELTRRDGVTKQYVRKIVEHIRSLEYRMSELRWGVAGSRIHFQAPDGQWEDGERSQFVAVEVLDLEPLKKAIRQGARREKGTVGQVEQRRGALGNKALVAGTRVPVSTIERYLEQGFSTDRILQSFPALALRDIEAVRRRAS